jgi:hypothetical protein
VASTLAALSTGTEIVSRDPQGQITGWVSTYFRQWLLALTARLESCAQLLKAVTLTDKSASIATTAVPLGTLAGGIYRVHWYARVTTPATTSSSLTVTISWTDDAIVCTASGAALTGNTTTTVQSGTVVLEADRSTAISYATAYASVGATAMVYKLDVTVELLS